MKRGKSVDFTGYWLAMETLGPQSSNDLSISVKPKPDQCLKSCALFRTTLEGYNLARTSFIPKHACFFKRFSAIRSWWKVLRLFKRFVRSNSPFRLHRRVAAISRAHCYLPSVPNSFFSSDLGRHEWLDQVIAPNTVAKQPDRTLTRSQNSILPEVIRW
jgi:hypothetical protein